MTLSSLTHLAVAFSVAHGLHALMEVVNIRRGFANFLAGRSGLKLPYPNPLPFEVDRRWKASLVGAAVTGVLFTLAWIVTRWWAPDITTGVAAIIVVQLAVELINTLHIDQYHRDLARPGQAAARADESREC